MKVYIRYSEHIQEDIERGWSSWNFGQDGINATEKEFEAILEECLTNENMPLCISGYELYSDEIKNSEFGELYTNYWVLKDQNFAGLCCSSFDADSINDAIEKMHRNLVDFGAGESLPCEAKLVYSKDNLHLFVE